MLAKAWREHDDYAARDKLIHSHLRLVVRIAANHRGYCWPEDRISEGTVGLIEAVQDFDPERGFRLSTYVWSRIEGQIWNFGMYFKSLVKMGTTDGQKKLFFNLKDEKAYHLGILHDDDMRPEQVKQIAERLNVREEEVIEINRRLVGDNSLNTLMLAGKDFADDGVASQESQYIEAEELENARKALNQKLGLLDDRELRIVVARWLDDKRTTLETLADEFGISCERVRQIEKSALEKMGLSHLLVRAPKEEAKASKEAKVVYATREEWVEVERASSRVCTLAERVETEQRLRASGTNAFRNATKSELAKIKARRADKVEQAAADDIFRQDIELPNPSFVVGAEVYVLSGPFATLKGTVEEVDEARSRVEVAMSGCATSVELKFGQIKQISKSIKQRDAWKPGNSGVAYPSRRKNEALNE